MKLYVFSSTTQPKVHGFTHNPKGANLPPQSGPWKEFQAVEMNSGGGSPYGVNTDGVLMAIHDTGYYLTAAELKLP